MGFYWIQAWQLISFCFEAVAPLLAIPLFIISMFNAPAYGIIWIILNILFASSLLYFKKSFHSTLENIYSGQFLIYPVYALVGDVILILFGWYLVLESTSKVSYTI
jgi:hypothetical protein